MSTIMGYEVNDFGQILHNILTIAGKNALVQEMKETESDYDTLERFEEIATPENAAAIWTAAIATLGSSVVRVDFSKWLRRVLLAKNTLNGTLDWSVNDDVPEIEDETPEQEFERFWETHGFEARRTRKLNDLAYAQFERQFAARQFQATAPPDGVNIPTDQTEADRAEPHAALRKFASDWLRSSRSSLKPINGRIVMAGGESFTVPKFDELVAAATAAQLI